MYTLPTPEERDAFNQQHMADASDSIKFQANLTDFMNLGNKIRGAASTGKDWFDLVELFAAAQYLAADLRRFAETQAEELRKQNVEDAIYAGTMTAVLVDGGVNPQEVANMQRYVTGNLPTEDQEAILEGKFDVLPTNPPEGTEFAPQAMIDLISSVREDDGTVSWQRGQSPVSTPIDTFGYVSPANHVEVSATVVPAPAEPLHLPVEDTTVTAATDNVSEETKRSVED